MKTEVHELCPSCRRIFVGNTGMTIEQMLTFLYSPEGRKEYDRLGGVTAINNMLLSLIFDNGHCTKCAGLVLARCKQAGY